MKKVLSGMVAAAFVLAGGACFAQGAGPVYVKVLGSFTSLSDPDVELIDPDVQVLEAESDSGYGVGAAVGMQFGQFRVEAELAHQINDIDALTGYYWALGVPSGDIRITSYMANGYYEFPIANGWGIYLMGGLGMATTDINIQSVDDNDSTFAFKGGAGVSYTINSNMAVDVGYEYLNVDDVEINDGNDKFEISDIYSNNLVAAFRYRF